MNRASKTADQRSKVIEIVEALPAGVALAEGNHLSLEVRGKRFGWYLDDHHDDGRVAINCKAQKGVNQSLSNAFPERFHIPKYVGHHGWIGLWLDVEEVDWCEVANLLNDAYRLTAAKSLVAELDDSQ